MEFEFQLIIFRERDHLCGLLLEDIIKMALREINCEDVKWIAMTGSHNNFDETVGSVRAV
jgi:hypothetical protein